MKKKLLVCLLIGVCTLSLFGGCKKKDANTENEVAENVTETETEETREGMLRSPFTGVWIDEEIARKRPIAVMTENTRETLPQYGLSSADVIYECPVEGGISRLMCIYQDYEDLDKIGNIRSCRIYYPYFAHEFDAIYFHAGQNVAAIPVLESEYIDAIDGTTGKAAPYYIADSSRKAPHHLYTSGELADQAIETYGYETTLDDDYKTHYQFAKEDEPNLLEDGNDCAVIQTYFLHAKPWFTYNEEDGLYYRFEFGEPQMDALNDTQIAVKNVIIQEVTNSMLDESAGTLWLDYIGTGVGKYITNGKCIDITWERESDYSITRYYDKDGNEIQLNPGKTWVEVTQAEYTDKNVVYATLEDFENK
ncbi:MAG: DUF3048 domain-containing protein [Agathobacter sp.]|nr:DUF3048 domain-containing protein [Agathobacter sp.]